MFLKFTTAFDAKGLFLDPSSSVPFPLKTKDRSSPPRSPEGAQPVVQLLRNHPTERQSTPIVTGQIGERSTGPFHSQLLLLLLLLLAAAPRYQGAPLLGKMKRETSLETHDTDLFWVILVDPVAWEMALQLLVVVLRRPRGSGSGFASTTQLASSEPDHQHLYHPSHTGSLLISFITNKSTKYPNRNELAPATLGRRTGPGDRLQILPGNGCLTNHHTIALHPFREIPFFLLLLDYVYLKR